MFSERFSQVAPPSTAVLFAYRRFFLKKSFPMALISFDRRVIISIGKKTSFLLREGQVVPPPSTWSSLFYFSQPQMLPANDIAHPAKSATVNLSWRSTKNISSTYSAAVEGGATVGVSGWTLLGRWLTAHLVDYRVGDTALIFIVELDVMVCVRILEAA